MIMTFMQRWTQRTVATVALAAAPVALLSQSCLDPTQVTVVVTTNDCNDGIGSTALYISHDPGTANGLVQAKSPNAETATCAGGKIGTLVVTHGTESGAIVVTA